MSASNLGIIFGPTLIRPRQTDATVSLSSLVDYPYQARVVELLITYYEKIFDVSLKPLLSTSHSEETAVTVRVALSADEREPQPQRKSFVAVKEVSDSCCHNVTFCVKFWSIPEHISNKTLWVFFLSSAFSVEFSFISALTFVSRVFK